MASDTSRESFFARLGEGSFMRCGMNASLTRENPSLRGVVVGVDWSTRDSALADRLAMAAILCDRNGKAISSEHFVFFNQIISADLSTERLAEVLGDDDEQVEITLPDVPEAVSRIAIVLYVNEGMGITRTLGQLDRCVVRVLDVDGARVLARSVNLGPNVGSASAAILAEVYRHNGEWKFKVIGQGYAAGLNELMQQFGVAL